MKGMAGCERTSRHVCRWLVHLLFIVQSYASLRLKTRVRNIRMNSDSFVSNILMNNL